MRVISMPRLRQDTSRYPDVKNQIESWYSVIKKAKLENLEEVRQINRETEAVGNFTVFNLKGNHYRLIVGINYETQTIYYKYFLTHSEYDKERWKNDPYF